MNKVIYEGNVMWAQVDANNHLRHSAYADFAAQARLQALEHCGFNADHMEQLQVGPILFREELIYMREVRPNDRITVSCVMTKCRADGSRWSFIQELHRGDGVLAAVINVDGAWIDTRSRRLTALPAEWTERFMSIPKSDNFQLEPVPEKKAKL